MESTSSQEIVTSTGRVRMVGTFTLGFSLVIFGSLFALQTFLDILGYTFILKLWPLILILLGFEVLLSYLNSQSNTFKYDKGAILLMFLLSGFAMCMAIAEFFIEYGSRHIQSINF